MKLAPFNWDPLLEEMVQFPTISIQNRPKIDIEETDKDILVKVDIPGIEPKNIDIEVNEDILQIGGKFEEERETKEKNYYRKERSTRSFERTIQLPCTVIEDKAKAECKNGVLHIKLPKSSEQIRHGKHIPVEL